MRAEKERATAAALAPQQETPPSEYADGSAKRKRDEVNHEESATVKKSRIDEAQGAHAVVNGAMRTGSEAPSEGQSIGPKRDREHTSVIVRKLPAGTTQTRIRQFFTDAGTVRNLILKEEQHSMTAIVEFESPEEAEYALSKQAKGFEGHDITIERGQSTTLYVTNYPPHAGEAFLRNLFGPFGEIVGVRFPSLKYAAHRRFCYLQYDKSEKAIAAN